MIPVYMTNDHYMQVRKWWEARGHQFIPMVSLPRTSIIIEDDLKRPVAFGCVYMTDSDSCMMEWITTNPESSSDDRDHALNLLIYTLKAHAETDKKRLIFSYLQDAGLMSRYGEHGFQKSDENMTHFLFVRKD
jgi:hypothetical protein